MDTLFAKVPQPVFSAGISGGVSFINPTDINDQIQFNNSAFNTTEPPIRTPGQFAVWFGFRPPNLPSVLSIRGEMLRFSRVFSYTAKVTGPSGATISTFSDQAISRYSLYAFSMNAGAVMEKTRLKLEIGFIFALAVFDDEVSMGPYGKQEKSYNGQGNGFRIALQQMMPLSEKLGLSIDFAYRYLRLDEFRDNRGVFLKDMEANFSGVTLMMGLSYGF